MSDDSYNEPEIRKAFCTKEIAKIKETHSPSQENVSCNAPELEASNALSKEEGIPKDTLGLPSSKASEHYKRGDDVDTKHNMTKMDSTHSPHDGKDREEEINVMPLVDSVCKSNRIKNPLFVKQNKFLW